MLAELAAANAAFAVIKGALANGKELSALGSRVFDYFDNKAVIQEKATKKGGGWHSRHNLSGAYFLGHHFVRFAFTVRSNHG
jgi:hypothetical protein